MAGTEGVDPRPERQHALGLVTAPEEHAQGAPAGLGHDLLDEPALAHAGLAGDEHEAAATARRLGQRGPQPAQLGLAADQRRLGVHVAGAPRGRAADSLLEQVLVQHGAACECHAGDQESGLHGERP